MHRDPDRRWQDTLQFILSGDVETFYLPNLPEKEIYLHWNRDPRLAREMLRRGDMALLLGDDNMNDVPAADLPEATPEPGATEREIELEERLGDDAG